MAQEIGFIHLSATILVSGLLDEKILQKSQYESEKKRVKSLLDIRYDIVSLPIQSREEIEKLIRNELQQWWKDSWFNVQIDSLREEILNQLRVLLTNLQVEVHRTNHQSVFVEGFHDCDFRQLQRNINHRFPGLICYYAPRESITKQYNY